MHHVMQKNKRVLSGNQKRPPSGNKQTSTRHFIGTNSESKLILDTINSIENDLRMRVSMYGIDSPSTIECLQHFVKTCNDHSLHLIKIGDQRTSSQILLKCEQILITDIASQHPSLKFQTYNNIAHFHNVQGNVRLSLKYLLRALEFGLQIEGVGEEIMPNVPIVETYLNITNAYNYLGQLLKSVEYAEGAIGISQSQLNHLMLILDDPNVPQNQKEALSQSYHSTVSLHTMAYHNKGQIFEKMKRFEDAIAEYQQGKQIIESNYGTQHKSYVEFANAINGAKLRTKYITHSNIPGGHQQHQEQDYGEEDEESSKQPSERESLNILTPQGNLFLKEQERMKPISQQKLRKKVLRPASAKTKIVQNSNAYNSDHATKNNQKNSYKDLALDARNKYSGGFLPSKAYKLDLSTQSDSQQEQLSSARGVRSRPVSGKQKRIIIRGRKFSAASRQNHDGSLSHGDNCVSCHRQLEELRKMHIEQQQLMNTIMQQQLTQSQSMMNISQQNQQQQNLPSVYQNQQNPYYYPQYPQPIPPQMYPYYPYPFYPPPPMGFPPMNNNFMNTNNSSLNQDSPGGNSMGNQFMPQFMQPPPFDPRFMRPQNLQRDQVSGTTYTDINERDQDFVDKQSPQNNSKKAQNLTQDNPLIRRPVHEFNGPNQSSNQSNSQQILRKTDLELNVQQNQIQKQKNETHQFRITEKEHQSKLNQAAVKIQTYYRKYRFEKFYNLAKSLNKKRFKFHQQVINYKEQGKMKILQLIVSLICTKKKQIRKGIQYIPESVVFQFYSRKDKKIVMETTQLVQAFGFKDPTKTTNEQIFNIVKNFLSHLKMGDQPIQRILESLKDQKIFKESNIQINFIDPQYLTTGINEVQKIKVQEKKPEKYEMPKDDESEEYEDKIDESIQDEYSIRSKSSKKLHSVSSSDKEDHKSKIQQRSLTKKQIEEAAIKIQARARGFLERKRYELKLMEKESKILTYQIIQREKRYYLIKIRERFDKHQKTQSLDLLVTMSSGKKCQPFRTKLNKLPCAYDLMNDYIKLNTQVDFDQKQWRIMKVYFKDAKVQLQQFLLFEGMDEKKQVQPKKEEVKRKISSSSNESAIEENYDNDPIDEPVQDESIEKSALIQNKQPEKKKKSMSIGKAACIIQARARAFLEVRRKALLIKNEVICSFIFKDKTFFAHVNVKHNRTQKYFAILVGSVLAKKDEVQKIFLEQLPIESVYLKDYLKQALIISWGYKGEDIVKAVLDLKLVDIVKIKKDTQILLQEIKTEKQEYDQKVNVSKKDSDVVEEQKIDQPKPKMQEVNQEKKKKSSKHKEAEKKKKYVEQKVTKLQARVRGVLTRNQCEASLEQDFKMLMRMSRKLSDGKLYYIFLMQKKLELLESNKDTLYIITMREVQNINEIYDLEMSLDMAKKIFGRKNASKDELNILVTFDTNKEEFIMMLQSLDIKEQSDFQLDFQKFRILQTQEKEIRTTENFYAQPVQSQNPTLNEKPSLIAPKVPSQSVLNPNNNSDEEYQYDQEIEEEYKDEEVIDEIESKYETSPGPKQSSKNDGDPSKAFKQQVKENKVNNGVEKRHKAAIVIQKNSRAFLARNQYNLQTSENFKNAEYLQEGDPQKKLKLIEKGTFSLQGIYFMFFVYTDDYQKEIKYTLKAVQEKKTIINLKQIYLEDFSEENVEISQISEYIKDSIIENADELLLDSNGKLKKDWIKQLRKFIQENI